MKMKKKERKSQGGGGCVQRMESCYCEKEKKGRGRVGGVRVDVNGEVKLL